MSKTMRRMALALACGVLALMGWVPAHASEDASTGGWVLASTGAPVDVSGTPSCEDEGQEHGPCLWDASTRGNGEGDSFIVEEDGSVSYLRKADGTATVAPTPAGPPEARAYPGWVWTGRTAPVTTPGLPACVDVHGQETCIRQGYTLVVDQSACTQTIVTDQGNQYVPGPAVAQALSDSCQAHKPDGRDHKDDAGWGGARSSSTGVVHSATPSAAVGSVVDKPSSPSRDKVVGPVDSGTKDNYDVEVVVAFGALVLLGLAAAVWVERRATERRLSRLGSR